MHWSKLGGFLAAMAALASAVAAARLIWIVFADPLRLLRLVL